jgi:hypothetical protein
LNGEKLNHSQEIDRICRDLGIEKTHQWLCAMVVVHAYYFIAQDVIVANCFKAVLGKLFSIELR